eukprot:gene6599-biopygen2442
MARGRKNVIMLPTKGDIFVDDQPFPREMTPKIMQEVLIGASWQVVRAEPRERSCFALPGDDPFTIRAPGCDICHPTQGGTHTTTHSQPCMASQLIQGAPRSTSINVTILIGRNRECHG